MLCVAGAETQLDDESTDHGREQDPAPPVRSLDPLLAAAAESNARQLQLGLLPAV